jgi:hypothetical protein
MFDAKKWLQIEPDLKGLPGGVTLGEHITKWKGKPWGEIAEAKCNCSHFPREELYLLVVINSLDVRWPLTIATALTK